MTRAWLDPSKELVVHYDPHQRMLYERNDPAGAYYATRWPEELRQGRQRDGRFPEIAVREHFRRRGYHVLISEPRMPDGQGFILVSYAGMRRRGHPAYLAMRRQFPDRDLDELNRLADEAKVSATGNARGGDPDLFVYRADGSEKFFVEVKDDDKIHAKQLAVFPVIEEFLSCEIRIVRIEPREGAEIGEEV